MRLDRALDSHLDILGERLELNLAFDVILRLQDLDEEQELSDADKNDVMLRVLVRNYKKIKKLPDKNKAEIIKKIFDDFIGVKSRKASEHCEKVLDFTQDAPYIYASFLLDYGINLLEQQGKLDWRVFIALLQGLSDKTKIREVMSIRSQKIPPTNRSNADQVQALRELKALYALDISDEEARGNVQQGLAKLMGTLSARAKGGENNV